MLSKLDQDDKVISVVIYDEETQSIEFEIDDEYDYGDKEKSNVYIQNY